MPQTVRGSDRILQKAWRDDMGVRFVPLTTPLTSTSWDGDARSTTAATLIDLSAVFGAPAGIKAVLVTLTIRDSGSDAAGLNLYLNWGPSATYFDAVAVRCGGITADSYASGGGVCPCDANGDVYYRIAASGAGTMDVTVKIWGYWV